MKDEIEFIDLLGEGNLKSFKSIYRKIVKTVKKELGIDSALGLSVTYCDNEYIRELNKNYRNKDSATDVLSFAIEDGEDLSFIEELKKALSVREIGDIVISYERASEQASEYGHSLERELCFLFVHGVLHLLGYDHMEKDDEKVMFDLQNKILDILKICR